MKTKDTEVNPASEFLTTSRKIIDFAHGSRNLADNWILLLMLSAPKFYLCMKLGVLSQNLKSDF